MKRSSNGGLEGSRVAERSSTPRQKDIPIFAGVFFTVALVALLALWLRYSNLRANADSLLRQRVIATLSARFNSPVQLDSLHLETANGVRVTGTGLRILYLAGPTRPDAKLESPTPMLSISSFEFTTSFLDLLKPTTRILSVLVRGMQIDIPPHNRSASVAAVQPSASTQSKISLVVDRIVCLDSRVVIETSKPGKLPLVFNASRIALDEVGAGKPMAYDATLINPKPVGDVRTTGHFGPWHAADPRDTPLDGSYWFTHADLSTIKGLRGTLSSSGKFSGSLGAIAVEGTTDTPDFSLDISAHPLPMHTGFHVDVNGTTGDLLLKRVDVKLLHTLIHCTGSVTRIGSSAAGVTGHDTELAVVVDEGRIEDMLVVATRTDPPVLMGSLTSRQRLSIPPGKQSISRKLRVSGNFTVQKATFSNPRFQQTVDEISMRARGLPQRANRRDAPIAQSVLSGEFIQADSLVTVSKLHYGMPGATSDMSGQYSLDGQRFDFQGSIRTVATASQMTTGWKSRILRPFDFLLKRDGAGMQIPITIKGTKSAPKLGMDLKRLF